MALLLNEKIDVDTIGGVKNAYKFILEVIENSTDIEKNTSNVTVYFKAYRQDSDSRGYSGFTKPKAIINIDNSEKTNVVVPKIYGKTEIIIASWTGDIVHNPDGNKSINVKAEYNHNSGNYSYVPANCKMEYNLTLTYIPRTSTFTATDAEIEGSCNISIDSKSSSFSHTLLYSFGDLSGTIPSLNWTIPTSFYNKIPNSPSGTCTITCITYLNGNEIGRTSKNITIKCN